LYFEKYNKKTGDGMLAVFDILSGEAIYVDEKFHFDVM